MDSRTKSSARPPRVTPFRVESDDLVVISFPLDLADTDARLTDAEIEIAAAIRDGKSNAEIARARGTSTRTVANQVAVLYKRLGVASRVELVRALGRPMVP